MKPLERYRGSLLGLAAGDALGAPLEGLSPGSFTPIEDMMGAVLTAWSPATLDRRYLNGAVPGRKPRRGARFRPGSPARAVPAAVPGGAFEQYGITEKEVRSILEEPSEEEATNLGRSYAQKLLFRRLVRVIYNVGMDEAVVVFVSIEALSFEDPRMALEECGGNLEIPERISEARLRR